MRSYRQSAPRGVRYLLRSVLLVLLCIAIGLGSPMLWLPSGGAVASSTHGEPLSAMEAEFPQGSEGSEEPVEGSSAPTEQLAVGTGQHERRRACHRYAQAKKVSGKERNLFRRSGRLLITLSAERQCRNGCGAHLRC